MRFSRFCRTKKQKGARMKMTGMVMVHIVTFLLVIVGALNWGLVGLFNFNLVNVIFGFMPMLERLVYILVGVSAVVLMVTHKTDCKICSKMKM
jgi:uncharacterized membrane protein YuzA (DUF378 family)